MHLLVREIRTLDEDAPASDLGQTAADIVMLSFSDADLGALAGAWQAMTGAPGLRLASLGRLRHPMSVDVYLEQVLAQARCIVVRLLGGLDYWRYGAEEVAALCRAGGIALALLPGDGLDDARLAALSTVTPDALARLDACFRHGGPANMARALRLASHLAGQCPDAHDAAQPVPQHGVHALDLIEDRPFAAVVFYRSHLLSADIAPIDAIMAALRARGLAVGALYVSSLKAPDSAAYVAATLRAWRPAVVLNATGFAARQGNAGSPLDTPGAPVLQLVLAGSSRAAWQELVARSVANRSRDAGGAAGARRTAADGGCFVQGYRGGAARVAVCPDRAPPRCGRCCIGSGSRGGVGPLVANSTRGTAGGRCAVRLPGRQWAARPCGGPGQLRQPQRHHA